MNNKTKNINVEIFFFLIKNYNLLQKKLLNDYYIYI